MEDILPSRRQAVVDRLRRRIEFYRNHQQGCYPRYNQTSRGLYEQQRQETLALKQRFLEAKAKKVRKNDHKAAKDQNCIGNERGVLVGSKLNKRTAEVLGSPVTSDGLTEDPRHPNKISRNSYPSDQGVSVQSTNSDNKDNQQPSSHNLPSFSVQIVQQFSSSSVAHVQHSQTIQTNVTVKAVNGPSKTSDSPLATASSTVSTDSQAQPRNGTISVGTNIECKQEKKISGQCCNHSSPSDLPNLDNNNNGATSRTERYSDTFSNFNFPDDSGDDVFHPDLLKDLIEDVFTNPSDLLMFEDSIGSVKDSVDDDKDSLASTIMDMGKLVGSPSNPQQFGAASLTQRSSGQSPHSASSLFDLGSTINNNSSTPTVSTTPFPSSGLGLEFKLTEPSPAALTLKQMAEQHQNMQQKQQQKHLTQPQQQSQSQQPQQQQQNMNLGLSPPSQPSFTPDNFPDQLSSIRSNFLNSTQSNLSQMVQKAPVYQTFPRQPGYQGSPVRPNNGMIFKQENFSANSPIDIELHKRQTIQQQQQIGDHKPPMNTGQVAYGSTRPLSHYTEPIGSQRQNQTFLRAQGPEITPPPLRYGSGGTPRPRSASTIHMSQSQQIQINQNTQHLQVSQEQQLRLDSTQPTVSANQQQSGMYVNYAQNPMPATANFRMSQMQNVSFHAAPPYGTAENGNHQSVGSTAPVRFVSQQRPPPPEYSSHVGVGTTAISVHQQQQVMSDNVRGMMIASQNQRVMQTQELGRRSVARSFQEPGQMTIHQGNVVSQFSQQETSRPNVTKPIYTNALTKNQRPPHVSIGPEGLNISQRSPSEWRQTYLSSHQAGRGQNVRASYIRPPSQPSNFNSSLVGDIAQNCNPTPVRVAVTDARMQRALHPSVSSPVTIRMTSPRTYGSQQITTSPVTITNQLYEAVQLPVTSSSAAVDSGHFDLTFLDSLDCSTSDLFNNLEQAIQESANSPFPLLEDMTLLSK